MLPISITAVLLAAIAAFAVGFIMHGPLFGKLWMRLANITPTGNEKFTDMIPQMLWNLVANIVTAYVLAVFYVYASTSSFFMGGGVVTAIICSLWLWIGFIVSPSAMDVIWMGRKVSLWLFECISSLLALVAMALIIGSW